MPQVTNYSAGLARSSSLADEKAVETNHMIVHFLAHQIWLYTQRFAAREGYLGPKTLAKAL